MSNIIFDDLEIDYSRMMSDPQSFHDDVWNKAEELLSIMKASTSAAAFINALPDLMPEEEEIALKPLQDILDGLLAAAEDLPIQLLPKLAQRMRKMASLIEWTAKDRAINEIANAQHEMPKSIASQLYADLREKFNVWVEAMSTLNVWKDGKKLPAMPGNYGSPVGLIHRVFLFEGESEGFRNHRTVAKRLGIEIPEKGYLSLMDVVEWVEAHPECKVTVKSVEN